MESKIRQIFTDDVIKHYSENKNEITRELLDKLHETKEGKQIALEILDTPQTEDYYHLDAFGEKISNNGNRQLKKPFTEMKLAPIHFEEIKRCKEDLNYFRENYIKIRTPTGINFPDVREYQQGFLDILTSPQENIVSLQPRQCCSGNTEITAEIEGCQKQMSMKELWDSLD